MDSSVIESSIKYTLIRSRRARRLRITIYPDLKVKVTAPILTSPASIERFVSDKKDWIGKKLDYFRKHPVTTAGSLLRKRSRVQFRDNKEKARVLITSRLEYFRASRGFNFGKVRIGNQKSRWGSCSRRGNLSFNYKIIYLPPELQDYLIVHELCHTKEFNHSRKFWDLVESIMPGCKELRKRLRSL